MNIATNIKKENTALHVAIFLLLLSALFSSPSFASTSDNHELEFGSFNYGGGTRSSESYTVEHDQITQNISGSSSSSQYALQSWFIDIEETGGVIQTDYYATSTCVEINLVCPDVDGCAQMQFSNDNINWSTPEAFAESKTWCLSPEDGNKTIYVRFQDNLGNWTIVYTSRLILDTVPPTLAILPPGGFYTTPLLISVSSSEPDNIYYTLDGSVPTATSSTYTGPVVLSSDNTFKVLIVDKAGNQVTGSATYSFCINGDGYSCRGRSNNYRLISATFNNGSGSRNSTNYQVSTDVITSQSTGNSTSTNYILNSGPLVPPTAGQPYCSIHIDADAKKTSSTTVGLNLICSDPNGCASMQISNNGVGWSEEFLYSTSRSWELTANDGERNVFVKYKNNLGNWSGICHDSIILDTTPPQVTISPVGGTYVPAQDIALTASEPATILYTTDESDPKTSPTAITYTGPVNITTDVTLKAIATDTIGNTGLVTSESYVICGSGNLSISGVVKDATLDQGIPLVTVTLDSGDVAIGDINGNYSFPSLPRGFYNIVSVTTASSMGYVTYQDELLICKTNLTNDITLTKDATVFGSNTYSGYSADSVNTATGNYTYGVADLEIPGRGIPFAFERSYNSQDGTDGPLGFGWTHNYNISLTEAPAPGNEVTIRWGDGKTETWTEDAGNYTPMFGVYSTLTKTTTFNITQKDGTEFSFDASNRLAAIVDEYGNQLTFAYGASGVDTVTDTVGRVISFSYDASNRITRVLGPTGRSVNFTYGADDLVTSSDLNGETTTYTYDSNHQLLTMTDPMDNVVVTNVYDDQRKVVSSQRDALGGQTLYSYDAAIKTTQLTDALGNVTYHHYDDHLRLIQEDDANSNSAYYVFDTRGNMVSVTDKNGNETTYVYDDRGNVQTKTEPEGRITSATFDINNNPETKTDANGNTTTYTYDLDTGNLNTVVEPLGKKTSYTYTPLGQVKTVTVDPDSFIYTTTYQYDIFGNKVRVIDAMGNQTNYTYDNVGRKLTETNALGNSMAYDYDNMDRLLSITDAKSGLTTFKYDANGNKIEHIDAKANKTTFVYDKKNRLKSKTNPLSLTESYGYDAMDRRTTITNLRGVTTSIVYDPIGNVIQEVDALGNRISNTYDSNGNKTSTTDAKGNTTAYTYDGLNRLVETTDPLGNKTTYTYDLNGNQKTVTDALGKTITNTYDELNRLVTVKDPLNNTITNTYDDLSRLIQVTDARNNFTSFEYDVLGRLVKVNDSEGGEVTATYDALGNRLSVTDTRLNITTYQYDELNRLTKETGPPTATNPLGDSKNMTYDVLGNLKTLTDGTGTTTYTYDALSRLVEITYPGSTSISYTYDANGNLRTVTDQMGNKTFAYDSLDRVSQVTDPFGQKVSYTYDPNHNRSSIKYPGNRSVAYYYDELNRLSEVQDWGGIVTSYLYDQAGRLDTKTLGNGSTVKYTYDDAGRLTDKVDKKSDGTVIASYNYTLDENGNRTGLTVDQPLVALLNNSDTNYTYDNANRIMSAGANTYEHDADGRLVNKVTPTGDTTYEYNENDRLTKVTTGSDVYDYQYDSHGRRYSSTASGVETRYLLDLTGGMENVLAEMDDTNALQTYYVYGDGLLYSFDPATGERLYYYYDPLGSTVALADQLENITDKYAYMPFGELEQSETTHYNPFTYVGQFGVMQEPTGLYFMRARYYDPETRRFMSVDPVKGDINNTKSINLYPYSNNNPISFIDPKGESPLGDFAAWGMDTLTFAPKLFKGEATDAEILAYGAKTATAMISATVGTFVGLAVEACNIGYGLASGLDSTYENEMESSGGYVAGVVIGGIIKGTFNVATTGNWNGNKTSYLSGYKNNDLTGYSSKSYNEDVQQGPGAINNGGGNPKVTVTTDGQGVDGDKIIPPSNPPDPPPQPKQYLNSGKYASSYFKREFGKLLNPNFLDAQTRTVVERRIDYELVKMQNTRYGYRTKEEKKRMKERLARDLNHLGSQMYTQLTSALSKHQVIIRDMAKMPYFTSGNQMRNGVYAGQ